MTSKVRHLEVIQNVHIYIAFSFIYGWNTIITPNLTHYLSQYSL